MIKILYIVSSSSPFGGSSRSFLPMCIKLVKQYGVQAHVILPTKNGIYYDLIQAGVDVSVVNMRFHVYASPLKMLYHAWVNYKATQSIMRIAKQFLPDIIHTNVSILNVGYHIAKRLHIPHIFHLREYQTLDLNMRIFPSWRNFCQKLHSKQNYSICITKGIQSFYGLNHTNSIVSYNGMIGNSAPLCLNKDPYFLFVGRLNEQKGIYDVLQAFALFSQQHTGYELWLVGKAESDAALKQIQAYCASLQIMDKVIFLGYRQDVQQLMQHATAYIMASYFEAFGRVTVEAMQNGCLVIGRNTAGTKEQFDNGLQVTGSEIGLRYETIEECAALMHTVAEQGVSTYKEMIKRAQQTVTQLYTVEKNAEQVYALYKKILSIEC